MSEGALPPLAAQQEEASRPAHDVWLSASAGTGKTQVLAARVYRLLLQGCDPERLLCLTFTKAGAAEMADRIHTQLGRWVTMKDGDLARDLKALGEDYSPDAVARARTLFAKVLDARGSGLRIQTIHSFCQSLLGSFPVEADLIPGFRAIEDREAAELHAQALSDLVETAHKDGDRRKVIANLQLLSAELGAEAVRKHLSRCAEAADAMAALGGEIGPKVRWWLELGEGDPRAALVELCNDDAVARYPLISYRDGCIAWGTDTGRGRAARIDAWLALDAEQRVEALDTVHLAWATSSGDLRSFNKNQIALGCDTSGKDLYTIFGRLIERKQRIEAASILIAALELGQVYAEVYAEAKRVAGVVDFGDLINAAARLLKTDGIGDWIRYKLDQGLDHLLIDEAQDTNARQWDIAKALTDEFYAGSGARGDTLRTLFTVGDYKQAIFGFQGTDPDQFRRARGWFARRIEAVGRELRDIDLRASFRSGQPVLDAVDAVIREIGAEAMGVDEGLARHEAFGNAKPSGQVVLWPPFEGEEPEEAGSDEGDDDEDSRASPAEIQFARDLARRVKRWIDGDLWLRNANRAVRPEDVMILLRSRGKLASLIVSRLHDEDVPVAGVDRLKLTAPLAVLDLLAAIRFVLQPDDDLNLAALLVSPLVGWSQDNLMAAGLGRDAKRVSLWQHLGPDKPEPLHRMLAMADTSTPYRFLEAILSGPIGGRRRLLERLGEEARDPIEALLNEALAFEKVAAPSLQLFIDWFDRGDIEIKRDAARAEAAVRVMTVHGAKGLQAPVVVLADATASFDRRRSGPPDWCRGNDEEPDRVPLFHPRKALRVGPLATAVEHQDARELREYWRLLYVAMTRAEEHLFIGGAIKSSKGGRELPENCWHTRIARGLAASGATAQADGSLILKHDGKPGIAKAAKQPAEQWHGPLPHWITQSPPPEARPPRPLAPSAAEAGDDVADPPPSRQMRAAAERGRLLHALFERLPGTAPADRRAVAMQWLERVGGIADAASRTALTDAALAVIEDPAFSAIFSADALAEAPLAGVVDGRVIAGTVDRLLIADDEVLVVDFKTGRRVPRDAAALPEAHVAQMAAYAAVLGAMFPEKRICAALLYSSGPRLIVVPPAMLARHKPGYRDAQDKLRDPA